MLTLLIFLICLLVVLYLLKKLLPLTFDGVLLFLVAAAYAAFGEHRALGDDVIALFATGLCITFVVDLARPFLALLNRRDSH